MRPAVYQIVVNCILKWYSSLSVGIKGFEPLNIRTKNEGLTNLAIFQQQPVLIKKGWDSNPRYINKYTKI